MTHGTLRPRRRRGLLLGSAAILATAVVLAGCSAPAEQAGADPAGEPVTGGVVTVALPTDPGTLDSAASSLQVTQYMNAQVFEQLFALDATYTPQPMLIDGYEMSEDRLTYTFTLRGGITFHDGSELDSSDVVASLERYFAVNGVGKLAAVDVASVEAPDAATVVITLSKPRYSLVSELANPGSSILPSEIASVAGATPLTAEQSIGTGPYELESYTTGQSVDLVRFDGYVSREEEDWGGYAGAKHAYLDGISYAFVAEDSTVVNGLTTGQWQVATPGNDQYTVLGANPDLVVEAAAGGVVNTLVLNHDPASVFSDPVAREALNYAVDKSAMAAASGTPQELLIDSGAFAVPDNAALYSEEGTEVYDEYDPEKAKQLFADAGVDTIRVLGTTSFPQMVAWVTVLQDELTEIGIDVQVESYDNTTVRAKAAEQPGSWDLSVTFINGVLSSPSQVNWLQPGYIGAYQNDELDALFADYAGATDDAAAKDVVDEIQAFVWQDIPSLVIYGSKQYTAYSSSLQGFDNFALVLFNSWLDES